jgi:hypothetical protein
MSVKQLEEAFERTLRHKLERRTLVGLRWQMVCTEPAFSYLINVEVRYSVLAGKRRDIFEQVFEEVQAEQAASQRSRSGREPAVA